MYAQSFIKGDKFLQAGIKIAIYNISDPDDLDDEDDNDRAASYTIPIGFEYAVSNKFGVGIELGLCKYFTEEDTITRAIADAGSFDVLLRGNFHWLRTGKTDLYSGLGIGVSVFSYNSNDHNNSKYRGSGGYIHFGLINARFYVSPKVAILIHMGFPMMDSREGRIKDDLGTDAEYPLKFSGWDLGTGLTVKF
jgi:hypothetical protein